MLRYSKFNAKQLVSIFSKWILICTIIGFIGSLLGVAFHHVLDYVTVLRLNNTFLLYFLPLGGLFTIILYYLFGLKSNVGTKQIICDVKKEASISPFITPAVFVSTAITHLFGGSAGREGAAVHMGGSAASIIGRLFKLTGKENTLIIMCGMSAAFSGLFLTPFTACFFCFEIFSLGLSSYWMLIPCFVSSIIADKVSECFRMSPYVFYQSQKIAFSFSDILKLILLSVSICFVGLLFHYSVKFLSKLAHKIVSNDFLRIVLGAVLIVIITVFIGDQRFNGAGMDLAILALDGNAEWYSFLLKILLTAVTLSVGFKGGEIVPAFCIGATFGCFFGGIIGLNAGFAASLGLIGLFYYVTDSPMASIVLSFEMFGFNNFYIFVPVCLLYVLLQHNVKFIYRYLFRLINKRNLIRNF